MVNKIRIYNGRLDQQGINLRHKTSRLRVEIGVGNLSAVVELCNEVITRAERIIRETNEIILNNDDKEGKT